LKLFPVIFVYLADKEDRVLLCIISSAPPQSWGMYLADTLLLQNTELCIVAATRMLFWLQFVCWFICLSATLCQTCYYLARYELANPHWRDKRVTISHDMNWQTHIGMIITKSSRRLYFLKILKKSQVLNHTNSDTYIYRL